MRLVAGMRWNARVRLGAARNSRYARSIYLADDLPNVSNRLCRSNDHWCRDVGTSSINFGISTILGSGTNVARANSCRIPSMVCGNSVAMEKTPWAAESHLTTRSSGRVAWVGRVWPRQGRYARPLNFIVSSQRMTTVPGNEPQRDAARLTQLIGGVRTLDETLKRLGPPDRDTSSQLPIIEGENVPRILVWSGVSEHWVVRVCVWTDGRFNSAIEPRALWVS